MLEESDVMMIYCVIVGLLSTNQLMHTEVHPIHARQ